MNKSPVKIYWQFDESGEIPKEIHVIPVGEWDHPSYGQIKISEDDVKEFVKNFNAGLRNDIPINEGHEVMDEKPAIGWFKKLVNKGSDGLWAVVEWTEQGKDLLRQKAYKYFSPEFYQQYEDPETRRVYNNVLVGGALTNKPYFKELTPVVFSEPSISNQSTMNIADIRGKLPSDLSAEEKTFIREHKDELMQDELAKFSEVLDEGQDKDSRQGEGEGAEDNKGEEGEGEKEKKEMSEKALVKISASELETLRKNAAEGVQANTKVRKMEFTDEVKGWMFNETTKKGKIAPKSKDNVVTFMLSLSDSQLVKFREIVTELPDSLTFAEMGDSGNTEVSASQELQNKIQAMMKDNTKLSYSEALTHVSAAHPELVKRQKEEVGAL